MATADAQQRSDSQRLSAPHCNKPKELLDYRTCGRLNVGCARRKYMFQSLKYAADAVLSKAVNSTPGVPGVVAIATDRTGNIYEGAAGKRQLGGSEAMTSDTVFAIFSMTKAITGTACLQLVEEGKLDLDAPAKTYAPAIGAAQVLSTASTAPANPSSGRRSGT
jgi:methyl acetate hydrolase